MNIDAEYVGLKNKPTFTKTQYSDHMATSKVVYYAMKVAENGELFNFVDNTPKFTEELARFYFHQLVEG